MQTRASTTPSIVCGSASASTRRPRAPGGVARSRDRSTRRPAAGRGPRRADRRSSSTVDDDVNVTASTLAGPHALEHGGRRAPPGTVRYTASTSTVVAARAEASGRTSRASSAPHDAAPARRARPVRGTPRAATRRRSARARGRRRTPRACERTQRCRARSRRPARPASARGVEPAGASPRSKNASTPLADVNTSHAYACSGGSAKSSGSNAIVGSSSTSAPSASSAARSSLACSRARVTTTERPNSGRRSNQREVERRRPRRRRSRSATARRRPRWSRASRARCAGRARVPLRTAATGVSGASPPSTSAVAMSAMRPAPMRITSVPPARGERVPVDVGAALRRVLVAGDDGEVRRQPAVRDRDARRRPAAPIALVMPGTTSNGTPAAASASASSPPRPNTNGSPPLSRTTVAPVRPRSTSSALISSWVRSTRAGRLARGRPARRRPARGRAARATRAGRSTTTSARAQQLGAAHA